MKRFFWSITLAAACCAAIAAPGEAQVGVNIHLGPQPPPRHEYYGRPPRPGCFWRRGHYVQRYNHWVWVSGRWICR